MSNWFDRFLQRGKQEAVGFLRDDLVDVERYKNPTVGKVLFGTNGRFFANPARRAWHSLTDGAETVGTVVKMAFRRDTVEALPTSSNDPAERFKVAQRIYNRSDAELVADQISLYRAFLTYMTVFACLVSLAIMSLRFYSTSLPLWLDITSRFALAPLALIFAAQASFYSWQLRTRRLCSVLEWLKNGDWWVIAPPGAETTGRNNPVVMLFLGTAVAMASMVADAASSVAVAGETGNVVTQLLSAPTNTDLWFQLMGMVFPNVGPLSGTVTPIHNGVAGAFGAMLSILMALAGTMLAYQTTVGLVATAHNGKVLGQRWNLMFAPVRVVVGFGTLAPVVKGYCILQIIIIMLGVGSGNLTNAMWTAFLDGMNGGTISEPKLQETMDVVRDGLVLEMCQAAREKVGETSASVSTGASLVSDVPAWPATYSQGPMTVTNNMVGRGVKAVVHGALLLLDGFANRGTQSWGQHTLVWDYGRCGKITGSYSLSGDLGADNDVIAADRAKIQAIDKLRGKLRTIAQQFIEGSSAGGTVSIDSILTDTTFQQIMQAKAEYDNALTSAAQAYVNSANSVSFDEFKAAATKGGWIAAGAYYPTLGRMSSEVMLVVGEQPKVQNGSTEQALDTDPHLSALLAEALSKYQGWWDRQMSAGTNAATLSTSAARAGLYDKGYSVMGGVEYLFSSDNKLWSWALKAATLTPGKGEALQEMTNFGNYIIDAGYGALAAVAGADLLRNIPIVDKAMNAAEGKYTKFMDGNKGSSVLSAAGVFVLLLAVTLLLCGIFHAFVLPMLPFIHFLFAVFGLLVTIVVGVIAAPFLAFAHVRLDGGDDFVDHAQKPGYQMAFSAFCGPPLTLMGLFFSMLVFEAMIWLMSKTIFAAMASATAGSTFGLLGTLTYVVMISVLNYQLATRSFHLITQVPDRVFRWFGVSGHGSSEEHGHGVNAVGTVVSHTRGGLDAAGGAVKSVYGNGQGQGAVDGRRAAQGGQNAGTDQALGGSGPSGIGQMHTALAGAGGGEEGVGGGGAAAAASPAGAASQLGNQIAQGVGQQVSQAANAAGGSGGGSGRAGHGGGVPGARNANGAEDGLG